MAASEPSHASRHDADRDQENAPNAVPIRVSYGTIVADPPWRYQDVTRMRARTAEAHYPTMEVSEIAALPIGELAASDSHLYMWVTNPILTQQRTDLDPFAVVRAWGFQPKTLITWVKPKWGMGFFYRGRTEHVIFAVRGHCPIDPAIRLPNVFNAPCGRHSEKPDAFMDMVEQVSPGPRIELFARRQRFGWDAWGNEVDSNVEVFA